MEKRIDRNYRYISFTVFLGLYTVSRIVNDFYFSFFEAFANPYTIPIIAGFLLLLFWTLEFVSVQLANLLKRFSLPTVILYPCTLVFYIWLLNQF